MFFILISQFLRESEGLCAFFRNFIAPWARIFIMHDFKEGTSSEHVIPALSESEPLFRGSGKLVLEVIGVGGR